MMRVHHRFLTQHDEIVHDVAYDFYGKRIATCSSDQSVRIWEQSRDGGFTCQQNFKAHSGSIWKVIWAHPEFGQVIATCSFDSKVHIYEEIDDADKKEFKKKADLVDSRVSIQDIKFSPRHLGLKIATCATDGRIRIYQAIDIMNLSHWSPMEEFDCPGATCISWDPARFDKQMIAVGCNDGTVKIFEYNDGAKKWSVIVTLEPQAKADKDSSAIHDVSWAPNVGRTYHLIASAAKDGVRVYKLNVHETKLVLEMQREFTDHRAEVWKVEWNITGTVLASSGDDGNVRLWKANAVGEWGCIGCVNGDQSFP
eukprot:TRINITY_DN3235_c0_g3_i1.p1 TRINITY_DN3235_c0_g3~~TRINITY_DN3235_c0_g3_i1.p1  ORF type:complete len:311 (-),score=58.44 TRINITY_DN3235_c0_g3_i1:306-1238(-)